MLEQLEIKVEECDADALKAENKQTRREIFALQNNVARLEAEVSSLSVMGV